MSQNPAIAVHNEYPRSVTPIMTETPKVTQEFLDSSQYLESSILQYESIYGADFVSPGGRELALEMIATMGLAPAARVLDVGCGLGGSAFVMAREFGLRVDGIDLSRNMLALAEQKLASNGLSNLVRLQWGDCLELDACELYEAIYSRDVFLHIADKARLFEHLHTAMRPGGRLLFSDYCCGPKPWSDEFRDYVQDRGYSLHTTGEYAELISNAGFRQVSASDETARFIEILQAEQHRINTLPIPAAERDYLSQSWLGKIQRAGDGDQRWGMFSGLKAT
ncbi:methyltransferase domain-containing protein [Gammaproteobacteria bacterium]|nr:methyltransferase domain-containing protein [Gammaproteobacteria bacterium]